MHYNPEVLAADQQDPNDESKVNDRHCAHSWACTAVMSLPLLQLAVTYAVGTRLFSDLCCLLSVYWRRRVLVVPVAMLTSDKCQPCTYTKSDCACKDQSMGLHLTDLGYKSAEKAVLNVSGKS